MTLTLPKFRFVHLLVALALAGVGAVLIAQIEGERGVPPIASGADFQVDDVRVDIFGPNADTARQTGWKLAQRKAWKELWRKTNGGEGPTLSDSVLDGLVSGIEVKQEQIGPTRYIATLAVLFDRARTGQALGVSSVVRHSPPLLIIPVVTDGGVSTTFETVTPWQRAWAAFRTGDSAIDYVRPAGDGPDAMLINAAQMNRRGRNWWRVLLEQYGAADVIMPLVRLERSWPGGPITGRFAARFGPDNEFIGSFELRANSAAQLPQMMAQGVMRMDQLYTEAFNNGTLRIDPSLVVEEPLNESELGNVSDLAAALAALPSESAAAPVAGSITVQFDTPSVESVRATETAIRSIPGVSSAATTSLALGGTSVMQVAFNGSPEQLRAAIEARGMAVSGSGTSLRVSRRPAGGNGGNGGGQ